MIPGIFGTSEGLMARMRTTITSGAANGYIAWCPAYSGDGGVATNSYHNLYYFENASSATNPNNTNADPFGKLYNTSGDWSADPAYAFLNGTTAADHRVVSACIILTYTGSVSSCSGEIALIPNVPTALLLKGGAGQVPVSVDDMFTAAPYYSRLGLEHTELKWHPGSRRQTFHPAGSGPCYYTGTSPTTQSISVGQSGDPGWCIIAFRNVPASSLKFTLTKVFEWRPEANVGFTAVVPASVGPESTYTDALRVLDETDRDWWRRAGDKAGAMLQGLVSAVFSGSAPHSTRAHNLGSSMGRLTLGGEF